MTDRELLSAVSQVTGIPINRIIKRAHSSKRPEVDARCLAVLAQRSLRPELAVIHLGEFVGLGTSSGSLALKRGNRRYHECKEFRKLARQVMGKIQLGES
ncbi:MAG: hypothetical protein WCP45_05930 [Verrucomicrobiota bacterium]